MILAVKVFPRSGKSELIPISATEFKAYLKSSPEKGKANMELVKLLAKHFDVARNEIFIKSGQTSHTKLIEIESI